MLNIEDLIVRAPARAADAALSIAGFKSRLLRRSLGEQLGKPAGTPGSIMAEPVLEATYPWKPYPGGWAALPASLSPQMQQALKDAMGYAPYDHQVAAWSLLCGPDARSVIVSSGTASGKTECFLGPLLNKLLIDSNGGLKHVTGVRGLMIYPLNALISSQQERLSRWLSPYKGKLRYCLYNGLTPEGPVPEAERRAKPEQVLDRRALREDPPPLLVTNVTMLEYMLVRRQDVPILQRSKGLLEYIVLDEAHTYVGAQAAELALLLRRVALSFGREPRDIRVIATSATLGSGDQRERERQLREFLRDLSGAPPESVHVIFGERAALKLPPASKPKKIRASALENHTDEGLWDHLAGMSVLQSIARKLHAGESVRWSEWRTTVQPVLDCSPSELEFEARALLTASCRARRSAGGDRLLPVRIHLFQRTFRGLWACCDANCPEAVRGEPKDWPFGKVFADSRETCDACGSLVLEVCTCQACGTEMLAAEEVDTGDGKGLRLRAPMREDETDDFALELDIPDPENAEETQTESSALSHAFWIMPNDESGQFQVAIQRATGLILDLPRGDCLSLRTNDSHDKSCPVCGQSSHRYPAVRGFRIGTPFMLGTSVPVTLAATTPDTCATDKPSQGRKLITFTDARQGTARLAAKLQADAERNFVRTFIYHAVQVRPSPATAGEIEKKKQEITALELAAKSSPALADILARAKAEMGRLMGTATPAPIPWTNLQSRMAQDATLADIKVLWEDREGGFHNAGKLADFLLLRELLRRPLRGNSAETMGLVRLVLPLNAAPNIMVPPAATSLGLSGDDWCHLLHIVVTHFLRANTIVDIPSLAFNWIDRRPTHIAIGQFEQPSSTENSWPTARPSGRLARVVSLLAQATDTSLDDRRGCDILNEVIDEVRLALQGYLVAAKGGFRLQMQTLALGNVREAWLCPVTRRVIDTTLRGLSPYPRDGRHLPAMPIRMPTHPAPFLIHAEGKAVAQQVIERFLLIDGEVRALREIGVWSELHDRVASFSPYFRSAEHSAQQPSQRLRAYEALFKAGDINVLNCSTTMEMGVDIGAMEAVINANTPPSIASYRQRVGRAGRRDQAIAAALTVCKERPIDRRAFDDPAAYLRTMLRAPRVSLDSVIIARRHANSWLLSSFLRERKDDALRMQVGDFFGFAVKDVTPPWREFLLWCDQTDQRLQDHGNALTSILHGTPVTVGRSIFEEARDALTRIAEERLSEWSALEQQEAEVGTENKPALRAIQNQKKRLAASYLLGELAAEGFLPAYGFPSGIVPLVTESKQSKRDNESAGSREDSNRRFRDYPSRQLEVALFEYAPGAPVVLDGLVYTSSGLTLNWRAPADEEKAREIQALRTAWRCRACGAAGIASSAARPDQCTACGSQKLERQDHISPAGFAVDINDQPHDDTLQVSYLPHGSPWVHATGGNWVSLPNGGRVRASAYGIVYFSNTGSSGHGYALCLQCGRAATESEAQGGMRPLPRALGDTQRGHRPLRGAPRDQAGFCPGSAGGFSIKRNLALGHAVRTSIVEVQLYDCSDADVARAVAVALREACASNLGIEPEEMGVAPVQAPKGDGGAAWCAVVFDRADGGAGFASTIADEPARHLRQARDLLDCGRAGRCGDPSAERFCTRCLLSADIQLQAERFDRKGAYSLLSVLVPKLEIAKEDKLFGPATELESSPLEAALARRLERGSSKDLILWLSDKSDLWSFEDWPGRAVAETWGPRGIAVRYVICRDALKGADAVARYALARSVQRSHTGQLFEAVPVALEGAPLAALTGDSQMLWACRDRSALSVAASWAASDSAPIVRGPMAGTLIGKPIDLESLLAIAPDTAVIDIGGELDGDARGFGTRLRRFIESRGKGLLEGLGGSVLEMEYTDRYVLSPLSVLLVAEVVAAFGKNGRPKVIIRTRENSRKSTTTPPWQVFHDWTRHSDRMTILQGLVGAVASVPQIQLDRGTPHRRTLRIKAEKGAVEITFDQGLGAWKTAEQTGFNFEASSESQIKQLQTMKVRVRNEPFGTFLTIRKL